MSNTYFQFKEFTIHQEHCAMKVCTDACLFGAWAGKKDDGWQMTDGRVLDIGAGTGLLSLMVAQRSKAMIDAVELDEEAARQAADNFEASPWEKRCQVIQGDARTVHLGRKYDLIISNPPFFEHDLKSGNAQRDLALHSESLNFSELLTVIKKYLADNGRFALLLPWHRKSEFEELAFGEGFYVTESVSVKQTPNHSYFRAMLLFGSIQQPALTSEIIIREGDSYSMEFSKLLQDYYLNL